MEETDMTPEDIMESFIAWSVDDVYNHWETFAVNASIAAYNFAIKRARKESDARTAQMKDFIESLIELYELENMEYPKGNIVYTPKDMR